MEAPSAKNSTQSSVREDFLQTNGGDTGNTLVVARGAFGRLGAKSLQA